MARLGVLSICEIAILIGIWTASAPVRAQSCCVPVQSQPQVSYRPQVSCAPQVSYLPRVSYLPQVSYRTVWRQVPVTTYRPVTYTDLFGVQTTYLQPMTAMQWQAQQEAYTSYVQSTSTVPATQWQNEEQGYTTYRPVSSNELVSLDHSPIPQSPTTSEKASPLSGLSGDTPNVNALEAELQGSVLKSEGRERAGPEDSAEFSAVYRQITGLQNQLKKMEERMRVMEESLPKAPGP